MVFGHDAAPSNAGDDADPHAGETSRGSAGVAGTTAQPRQRPSSAGHPRGEPVERILVRWLVVDG